MSAPQLRATMKAIICHKYGSSDDLELKEIEMPVVGDDGVLVRVRAASINPYDFRVMRGEPYLLRMGEGLRKPAVGAMGIDVAGQVEAVGRDVTGLKPGDEVFGFRRGAFAEYVLGTERNFVRKPAELTFEQAAAIPMAGQAALQGLRDGGHLQAGQRVLINGASGGVGTFAVQIAKALGAEVTAVCSTRNLDMVRSLGADHVIDYSKEDFTRSVQRYDLIFDAAGKRSVLAVRRVLAPGGILLVVGGPKGRFAPVFRMLEPLMVSRFVGQKLRPFMATNRKDDLVALTDLIAAGKVTPVIDRTYPISETPAALRYLEEGHARGKVVITVSGETPGASGGEPR